MKKLLKILGVGLVVAVVVHENKDLFELQKDLLKHNHWLEKIRKNAGRSK